MIKKLSCLLLCIFSQVALAASPQPDGDWKIAKKSCNAQPQAITQNETVYLRDAFYAQTHISFEDKEKICNQAQAFDRIIQSFSYASDKYEETSDLMPRALRTVCRNKATGQIMSDDTVPLDDDEPLQVLSMVLHASSGVVEINGSSFCKEGILHIEIQKVKLGGGSMSLRDLELFNSI